MAVKEHFSWEIGGIGSILCVKNEIISYFRNIHDSKKKNSEPSNQPMDSRNVNFSIKKSQIDTHMLGVAQKLTKLDIALETSVAWDSGSGSQKMPCPAVPNLLLFTFL